MLGREEMAHGGATQRELSAIDSLQPSAGLTSYLRWTLEKTQSKSGNAGDSTCRIARLYAQLGDKDAAFASLAQAFRAHDPMLVFLNVDPAYDSLRPDARFAALVRG